MLLLQLSTMPPGSTVKFYGPDPTPDNKADGIGPEAPGTSHPDQPLKEASIPA
jgi:hypothetical protein